MKVEKPVFSGNVRDVEFLENKLVIHYHLQRNWNVPDVTGLMSLDYDAINQLPMYQNRDQNGNYINDKNGGFSFYDIHVPKCSQTIVLVFQHSYAGQYDSFGDLQYPEDSIVGLFRHEKYGPIRVKYDKDWNIT